MSNLKRIFDAQMARQVGHISGPVVKKISVAECTESESTITLTAKRGQWEQDINEHAALCAVADAALDIATRCYNGVKRQVALDDAIRALFAVRVAAPVDPANQSATEANERVCAAARRRAGD